MASINSFDVRVEKALCCLAAMYPSQEPIRTLFAFDRDNGQFLLINEGWDDVRRIHAVWAHVELVGDRVYIQEDGSEVGIASLLQEAGIPKESIVLAFYPPYHRKATEFAVA